MNYFILKKFTICFAIHPSNFKVYNRYSTLRGDSIPALMEYMVHYTTKLESLVKKKKLQAFQNVMI